MKRNSGTNGITTPTLMMMMAKVIWMRIYQFVVFQ